MSQKRREIIYKASTAIGAVLMLYHILLKICLGYISFSSVFFVVGLILFLYGYSELKYNLNIWGHIPFVLRKVISNLFIIAISIFMIIEGQIIFESFKRDYNKPDYIIVLGAGIKGTKISASLEERLKSTLEFNKMYPEVPIVVSGGQGKGEDISEALAMKNYLISNGIDKDLIIMEDKSTSTYENFQYTYNLLKDKEGTDKYNVTVITNGFHMYRAKYIGESVGFNCYGYPAKTMKSTALIFYVREFFGVMKVYLFQC